MKKEQIEQLTCMDCGLRCSSLQTKRGGRFLEDRDGNFYISPVSITRCKARRLIKKGLSKDLARKTVYMGESLSIPSPVRNIYD